MKPGPSMSIELGEPGSVDAGDVQIDLNHPSRDAVIPKVRAQLRRVAGDQFTPYAVSIGPYHEDAGSWLWTQEKKRALQDLERFGFDLSDLRQVLVGVQSRARGYYTHLAKDEDEHAMDSEKFCSMLLHDGCYLLSLLVDYNQPGEAAGSSSKPSISSRDNTVARDILYLLENQIPMFVLDEILKYLGANQSALMCIAGPVEDLLHRQLYISKTPREVPATSSHLLDLVHSYLASSQKPHHQHEKQMSTVPPLTRRWLLDRVHSRVAASQPKGQQEQTDVGGTGPWLRATEYRRNANLRFKPRALGANQAWTILDVDLDDGSLLIPRLRVDSNTWTLLRNLMALEEHKDARPVTAYCLLMSQLVCTAEDVELLRSAKVIEHFLGTDKSAAKGFAGLCHGVVLDIDDPQRNYLKPIWHRLEKRCGVRQEHRLDKCCSIVFYLLLFFIAFVLLGCQVVQSIYAVKAYRNDPDA